MFFIFSTDLLLGVLLLCGFLLMLVISPMLTLIILGLSIWGLVAFLSRGGVDEDGS